MRDLCWANMRPMFDLISTPFQSPTVPLFLKCCVYTGLGFHSEEYILDQIHKISRSLKCYPCPPAPVLAHTAWDQSGSLRLASLRACRSQGCSNLFLIVRNCWLCSITVDLCRKPVP